MAFLYVYFDESGKKGDHPVVTFTGVCLSQSQLVGFEDAWNTLLCRYELKSLHMAKASRLKEANGPKMPRHQSIDERIDALLPFSDCINEYFELGLMQAMDIKGFNSLTEAAKKGLGSPDDPYYLAFARGLLEISGHVKENDHICLTCDDDVETAWNCYRHYRALRRVDPDLNSKVASLTFADDEYFPALQASDMVAFLSRLEARRRFYDEYNMYLRLFNHTVKRRGVNRTDWRMMFADELKLKDLGESMGRIKKKE
jgi:uncharacterized protein DUF3800